MCMGGFAANYEKYYELDSGPIGTPQTNSRYAFNTYNLGRSSLQLRRWRLWPIVSL